jgi:hypothetical protein
VDVVEIFCRAAIFVDKFLKEAKQGDPPIAQEGDSEIERSELFAFSRGSTRPCLTPRMYGCFHGFYDRLYGGVSGFLLER